MRLLFDQNLSHRLVQRLADVYPGSRHVREIGRASGGRSLTRLQRREKLHAVDWEAER